MSTSAAVAPAPNPSLKSLIPAAKVLATSSGDEVNLLEAVSARTSPVLIGWLRHYGCTLCKKKVNDWKPLSESLEIILIGNGTPAEAQKFADEVSLASFPSMSLYSDPSKSTYNALNFSNSISSCLNGPALQKIFVSLQAGNTQTMNPFPKNATQQGGALVVDEAAIVRFLHSDTFAGDDAAIDALENAIEQAKVSLQE